MKRFRRWVDIGAAIISAILCAATLLIWGRSYFANDVVTYNVNSVDDTSECGWFSVEAGEGGVVLYDQLQSGWPSLSGYRGIEADGFWADEPGTSGLGWSYLRRPISYPILDPDPAAYSNMYTKVGFQLVYSYQRDSMGWIEVHSLTLPLIIPTLLFAWLPFKEIRRRRKERRSSVVGFCAKCGYDLRATPNRCPECGTAVTKVQSAKPKKI